jgi:hypothetical protein
MFLQRPRAAQFGERVPGQHVPVERQLLVHGARQPQLVLDQRLAAAEQGERAPVGQVHSGVVEFVGLAEDLTVRAELGIGASGFAVEDRVYAPEGVHTGVQVGGGDIGFLEHPQFVDEGLRGQELPRILHGREAVGRGRLRFPSAGHLGQRSTHREPLRSTSHRPSSVDFVQHLRGIGWVRFAQQRDRQIRHRRRPQVRSQLAYH